MSVTQSMVEDVTERGRLALKTFWPTLNENLSDILDNFYTKLSHHPEMSKLLTDQSLDHLKLAQKEHWEDIFLNGHTPRYYERMARIGMAHALVGLAPHMYISSYGMLH